MAAADPRIKNKHSRCASSSRSTVNLITAGTPPLRFARRRGGECRLGRITSVAIVDGHLCVWQGGPTTAFARIPTDSANCHMLGRLLGEQVLRRRRHQVYALDLLSLCCVTQLVKPFVNSLLQCRQVLLLSVRQLQSILFGACHDPAGPRGRTGPAGSWRRPTFGEALVLVGRTELTEVGIDVFVDLVHVLPLRR